MRKMIVGFAALGLIVMSTTMCSALGSHPVPSGPTDTLMLGWERHFTLDWSVESTPHQTKRIAGHVTNHYGGYADHMRVLAQAVDASRRRDRQADRLGSRRCQRIRTRLLRDR